MAWINQSEVEGIPYLEKKKNWLKIGAAFNYLSITGEVVASIGLAALFFSSMKTGDAFTNVLIALLSFVFFIAGIILMWAQRESGRDFILALGTPNWRDDILKGLLLAAITAFILWGSQKTDKPIIDYFASPIAVITEDYNKSPLYVEKDRAKAKIAANKDEIISRANAAIKECGACLIVDSEYQKLISRETKRLRNSNADWAININKGIKARIKAIEQERDKRKEAERGRLIIERDAIEAQQNNIVYQADTVVSNERSKIDSSNLAELKRAERQDKLNAHYAGWFAFITQFLFFAGVSIRVYIFRKANMTWVDTAKKSTIMEVFGFVGVYLESLKFNIEKKLEEMTLNRMSFVINEVDDRRTEFFNSNEMAKNIFESGASSNIHDAFNIIKNQENFEKKPLKKDDNVIINNINLRDEATQNVPNSEENSIFSKEELNQLITSFKLLLEIQEFSEYAETELLSQIEAFELLSSLI